MTREQPRPFGLNHTTTCVFILAFIALGSTSCATRLTIAGEQTPFVAVDYDERALPARGYLKEATAFPMKEGTFLFSEWISFTETGAITKGTLATNTRVMIHETPFFFLAGKEMTFHTNGHVAKGMLAASVAYPIGGEHALFLKRTPVAFYPTGDVAEGTLAITTLFPVERDAVFFRSNTIARFHANGGIAEGTIDTVHAFAAGKYRIRYQGGSVLSFNEEGRVIESASEKGIRITIAQYDIAFKGALAFHEKGEIAKGVLAEDTTLTVGTGTYTFAKGYALTFYEDERVKAGTLAKHVEREVGKNTVTFDAGDPLVFYPSGAIYEGTLYTHQGCVVDGVPYIFMRDTPICFYESGGVKRATLRTSRDVIVAGATLPVGWEIAFHLDGAIAEVRLAKNATVPIDGEPVLLRDLSRATFYEDGHLRSGRLAQFYSHERVENDDSKTSVRIAKDEWIYFFRTAKGAYYVYTCGNDFVLTEETPVRIAGEVVRLPEGTRVANEGDTALFTAITPSATISVDGMDIARKGETLPWETFANRVLTASDGAEE